jgi:cation:H+ antiporter
MRADAALGALVSSKVNQWTLLIGCLPIAYALSSGTINPLPTDTRQTEEVLLTAAQSLLAVVLLINLRMTLWEGAILFVLFLAQFLTPHSIVPRNAFSVMYFVAAGIFLVRQGMEMWKYRKPVLPEAAMAHPVAADRRS